MEQLTNSGSQPEFLLGWVAALIEDDQILTGTWSGAEDG
jgi:hypothetical protein